MMARPAGVPRSAWWKLPRGHRRRLQRGPVGSASRLQCDLDPSAIVDINPSGWTRMAQRARAVWNVRGWM